MFENKQKQGKTRANAEATENLPTSHVDAPAERFQNEQQAAPMSETTTSVDITPFKRKVIKSKGPTLKTEVASEIITGKSAGGPGSVSSPSAFGLKEISFSGDTGSLLGNASGTPSMGQDYQGKTRIDKRLSDANKDINYNASEQVLVEYDNVPPLAASESTVGYNGNPKNVAARSQKKSGFSSAEMLYDRSLDLVEKDAFLFSSGQVVKQENVAYDDYPTITYNDDMEQEAFTAERGNYSPREIKVTLKKVNGRGMVTGFAVLEDDLSTNAEEDQVVNQSATNHLIDMNRAELARQTIDAEAGSPTSQHFNPLGRSVSQPTATVAYLQDIENVMGAEVFAAYKFANKARGHYLNRTAKDGQDLIGPALDALYGHLAGATDVDELKEAINFDGSFFSTSGMKKGSAAVMIPLFDSIGKYKTKADIVNQPRGLKMHLQTADNNIDPFRCKKEFVAALNSVDSYSTIDHEYDGMQPVFITDNVRLIHPYSWAEALAFTRDKDGVKTYTSKAFRYYYSAGSGLNSYLVTVGEPILNGVAYFLDLHAAELYKAIATKDEFDDGDAVELSIPVVHSTTHFSLWDLLVCASTPYIIYERTNALKDILDFEMFYSYPLQGNVRIADANPLNAVNYGTLSPYAEIPIKTMAPSSAIRWRYPESLIKMDGYTMLPYYFNERAIDWVSTTPGDASFKQNLSCEYTTPVVRSGMKLAGLDEFFGMEVKDQLLITDRFVRIPGFNVDDAIKGSVYKYGQDSDGIPCIYNDALTGKTVLDYYATPRLLGWYFDAPARVCQVYFRNGAKAALGNLAAMNTLGLNLMMPSYRAVEYKGIYASGEKIVNTSLDVGSVNVNRAQAFTQVWGMKWAGSSVKSKYFDLTLAINDTISFNDELSDNPRFITLTEKSQFSPFTYGPYSVSTENGVRVAANSAYRVDIDDRPIVYSPHVMLWTLLQKLPFIINPFENSNVESPSADPFGVAYIFGLAGFMSANYDEEIFNRINKAQNDGYGYTADPMTSASPIFKDAYANTQIG